MKSIGGSLALVFSLSIQAAAWGPLGHRTIAQIAQERLTPQALAAVQGILGKGAKLADISPCADAISHNRAVQCGSPQNYFDVAPAPYTKDWHFINIPVDADLTPAEIDHSPYCGQRCVVEEIHRWLTVLKKAQDAPRDVKQKALMFVVHLVGDIHQPLHCATRISGSFDDAGGSRDSATLLGRRTNLHSAWDQILGIQNNPADFEGTQEEADRLTALLDGDLAGHDAGPWLSGDIVGQAAYESFTIAKDTIYPAYDKSHDIDAAYQRQMLPVAYQRLEAAGVRLAFLLNNALGQ